MVVKTKRQSVVKKPKDPTLEPRKSSQNLIVVLTSISRDLAKLNEPLSKRARKLGTMNGKIIRLESVLVNLKKMQKKRGSELSKHIRDVEEVLTRFKREYQAHRRKLINDGGESFEATRKLF